MTHTATLTAIAVVAARVQTCAIRGDKAIACWGNINDGVPMP